MHEHWRNFLLTQHALIEDDTVIGFGENRQAAVVAHTETVLVDLSHYALLAFSGKDAQSFLQNQLSCDVTQINANQAQHGSYCSPKGRVLANFILWQNGDEWLMRLPASLCAPIQKRLSLFVLRSKVQISARSDQSIRFGVAGDKACTAVAQIMQTELDACKSLQLVSTAHSDILYHDRSRIELISAPEYARTIWEQLLQHAQAAGAANWDWHTIQAGIPTITPPTQEAFLPQMINLDLIGGVSFKKGCYPGQEIVARTQYLGKLKRRMYLAHIATGEPVCAGDELFDAHFDTQACGQIVNAAPSPNGGYDVLAVIQQSSIDTGTITWKEPQGCILAISSTLSD